MEIEIKNLFLRILIQLKAFQNNFVAIERNVANQNILKNVKFFSSLTFVSLIYFISSIYSKSQQQVHKLNLWRN